MIDSIAVVIIVLVIQNMSPAGLKCKELSPRGIGKSGNDIC